MAALKKSKLQGVLKIEAPATCLFKEFEELSKMATLDLYQSVLGDNLKPEYLVATKLPAPVSEPAPASTNDTTDARLHPKAAAIAPQRVAKPIASNPPRPK